MMLGTDMYRTVFLHLVTSLSYRPESSSITRIATALTIVCNATNRIQYNIWSVKKLIQSHVSINPSITIHDMGENSTIILSPSLSVSRWHTIWQACHCLIRTCMSFIAFHPSSTEDMGIYLCSPGSKSWSKISSVSFSYLIASKVMFTDVDVVQNIAPRVLTCTMVYFHFYQTFFSSKDCSWKQWKNYSQNC